MSVERLCVDCMNCMLRKYMGSIPEEAAEAQRVAFMQALFRELGHAPTSASAPMIVDAMDRVLWEIFGIRKDYSQIKAHFNQVMLSHETEVSRRVVEAADPVKAAIQYAMVGNYIDFGAMNSVSEEYLTSLLATAGDHALDEAAYEALRADLAEAKKLVFVTDNCGEIVMDKVLIRQIQAFYPGIEVTVMVRGRDVINDATMADAEQVGLPEIARVIGNGNGIGGTCFERLSVAALEAMDEADVILAKGQGNFETMRGCGRNVYYLFLCKCDMFARKFGVPKYTGMLINDKDC